MGKKVSQEYARYTRSIEWKTLRQHILTRDKFCCVRCGGSVCLEVHHKTYERFGHELMSDLETLCFDCHNIVHDTRRKKTKRWVTTKEQSRRSLSKRIHFQRKQSKKLAIQQAHDTIQATVFAGTFRSPEAKPRCRRPVESED